MLIILLCVSFAFWLIDNVLPMKGKLVLDKVKNGFYYTTGYESPDRKDCKAFFLNIVVIIIIMLFY